jgi:hypothetical protein
MMTRTIANEEQAVADVIDRLVARFPDLPKERISDAVAAASARLAGAKVRDFVPVLVEREARGQLEQRRASA